MINHRPACSQSVSEEQQIDIFISSWGSSPGSRLRPHHHRLRPALLLLLLERPTVADLRLLLPGAGPLPGGAQPRLPGPELLLSLLRQHGAVRGPALAWLWYRPRSGKIRSECAPPLSAARYHLWSPEAPYLSDKVKYLENFTFTSILSVNSCLGHFLQNITKFVRHIMAWPVSCSLGLQLHYIIRICRKKLTYHKHLNTNSTPWQLHVKYGFFSGNLQSL